MKLIGLDVGTKRIGVAKVDSKVRIAIPYSTIEVDGGEFAKIASLARAWDIDNFVLGLPRNNEGSETKQSAYVREFAKMLKKTLPGAKICFQDESLTSVEAERRLKSRKKSYGKGDIDSEAAAIILQDFLEQRTGKTASRAASVNARSVRGRHPHRLAAVVIAILLLLVLGGGAALYYYFYNLRPVAETSCSEGDNAISEACSRTVFAVETGKSVQDIAANLKEEGLIRDPLVFQIYFRISSGGKTFKAGEYDLSRSMSVDEITQLLLSGGEQTFSFTVFPGERVREIKERLVAIGYDQESVDAAFAEDYRTGELSWLFAGMPAEQTSLEGYLFGDTYEFYRADPASAIVRRLIQEMADQVKAGNFEAAFAEHGLNLYQGITLASVVQREANNAADMARIAQVFYNRLAQGMTLGSDPTAAYAVDLIDPERTTYLDNAAVIEIDSPYNTRKNPGLPYGPISNPGIDALQAVATPDSSMSEMLFFLTGDDQLMYYSDTDEGHQQNILEHCQILCGASL